MLLFYYRNLIYIYSRLIQLNVGVNNSNLYQKDSTYYEVLRWKNLEDSKTNDDASANQIAYLKRAASSIVTFANALEIIASGQPVRGYNTSKEVADEIIDVVESIKDVCGRIK